MKRFLLTLAAGCTLLCCPLLLCTSCVEEDWECPAPPPDSGSLNEDIDVPPWDDDQHQHYT